MPGLAGLARLDIHRLGALARATVGIQVQRLKGETGEATARRLAAFDRLEAGRLQHGAQLREIPQPLVALANAGQADVLCAESLGQQLQDRPRPETLGAGSDATHQPWNPPPAASTEAAVGPAKRCSPVRSRTKSISSTFCSGADFS